jgi:hypothetical protein
MALLRRAFYRQFPAFADPAHPVMRYTLNREGRRVRPLWRWLRRIGIMALILIALAFGFEIATSFGSQPLPSDLNPLDTIYLVTYWPLVIGQTLLRLVAVGMTTGVIVREVRHGTWETLKITTDGAILTLRTRVASVFYRVWPVLALIMLARLLFIGASLLNFISFNGNYLDDMISGTTPLGAPDMNPVAAVVLAVIIAAAGMTASILLPLTALAFDAALGTLIGTFARSRWLGGIEQSVILLLRVILTSAALIVGALAIFGSQPTLLSAQFVNFIPGGGIGTWLGAFFGIAEGDLGLTMLHQPHVQSLWADILYGVLIGIMLLIYALLQFGAAQLLIQWAGRRAVRANRL